MAKLLPRAKNQAFLLSMLRIAKTMFEELRANPSTIHEETLPFVPDRPYRVQVDSLKPGLPIYRLGAKPKFVGLVAQVEPSKDGQEYLIEYACGHVEVMQCDCSVWTCCNPD